MEIQYKQMGDYLVPDWEDLTPPQSLGLYGRLRLDYLKENYEVDYEWMLAMGTLYQPILEIQKQATEQMEIMTEQMAKKRGLCEYMTSNVDQMYWVQQMNDITRVAREIVLEELVYVPLVNPMFKPKD